MLKGYISTDYVQCSNTHVHCVQILTDVVVFVEEAHSVSQLKQVEVRLQVSDLYVRLEKYHNIVSTTLRYHHTIYSDIKALTAGRLQDFVYIT